MEGYSYSGANKKAGVTWNDENIMKWLENPKKVHQGKQNGLCRPQETPGSHGYCRLPEEDLHGVMTTYYIRTYISLDWLRCAPALLFC